MRPLHTRKLLSAVLGVVVLAAAWFYLAPLSLGGSASYVVTHGVSMEPKFHSGDLAVVRRQSDYHVGEIVAYDSDELHTIVLHRIVGMDGARYVFKGDNNNFIDFEHPQRSQLLGALWLHVPAVGGTLASIASPLLVAALIALGVILYAGAMVRKRRRRQRHRREETAAAAATARADAAGGATVPVLVFGMIALAPFLLLALLAFSRETNQRTSYQAHYHQRGSLSYSAAAAPGPAYQHGEAVTGEPLFTHVVGSAQLHFSYVFTSEEPHALAGAISLSAQLTSTSGWQHTIPLARPTAFHGDRASIDGTLDLGSMLALVKRVQTDTATNGTYMLAVMPHVSTVGRLAGMPLHGTFAPQIRFSVEPSEVRPVVPGDGSVGGAAGGHGANPLTPQAAGTVDGSHLEPLSLSLGIAHPSVADARRVALGGIAAVVVAILLALAFPFARPRRRGEADLIRRRYGRMIVPVERVWELPGTQVIDVADIESLVRIAEHYDRSILHETTPEGEAFWVTDESGQFRYAVARDSGPWAAPAAPVTYEWPAAGPPPAEGQVDRGAVDAAWPAAEPAVPPAAPERSVEPAAAPADQEWSVAVTPAQEHAPVAAPVVAAASAVDAEVAPEPALVDAPEPVVTAPPAPPDSPTVEQPAVSSRPASFSVQPHPPAEAAGLSPSEAAAAAFAAASRARAVGEDPWAEQVVTDALEHGSDDWRAACEAAGVVFDAPRSSRR